MRHQAAAVLELEPYLGAAAKAVHRAYFGQCIPITASAAGADGETGETTPKGAAAVVRLRPPEDILELTPEWLQSHG